MTDGTNTATYTYDAVGNRTMTGYTTGAFNRLTAAGGSSYGYNANGSMTSKATTTTYGWDRENRMVSASVSPGDTMYHNYDALGRRVSSRLVPFVATTFDPPPTRYTYDEQDVVLDDSSDLENTSIVKYQNAPGIDNKLSMSDRGTRYFMQDHLGSTVGIMNDSGSVIETNTYDSFGNPSNSSFLTRYQFTGREFDTFSGLQYSRARFYDPQIGRFISEDPIGFRGGDVNLYAYVWNNPIKFIDPTGEFGWCRDGDGRPTPCLTQWRPFDELFDTRGSSRNAAWRAEGINFPNGAPDGSADIYGGAYRHCVATCYLYRRYSPFGSIGRYAWDYLVEDPNDENSLGDMRGEDFGAAVCSAIGSCEDRCLDQYPSE